jgi:TPR repeat protein
MYLKGVGAPKDVNKAIELFTQAAEQKLVRAQSALAVRTENTDKHNMRISP